jgi:hypothetical protein
VHLHDPLEDDAGSLFSRPPSRWAGAVPLGSDIYWAPWDTDPTDDDAGGPVGSILVWHWCPATGVTGRWMAADVRGHTLVSSEPLHLEPSLLWNCCGKHGWIRGGAWSDA